MDVVVNDLIEVADIGSARPKPIRFAYENLCWGTHVDTWEGGWEVVRRVDRANFGLCLDTFNIAGRVWADPERADGKVEGDADAKLRDSLKALVETVDVSKVFYIQLVDAERLDAPLDRDHEYYAEDQAARMSWSRNARCFMGEEEERGRQGRLDWNVGDGRRRLAGKRGSVLKSGWTPLLFGVTWLRWRLHFIFASPDRRTPRTTPTRIWLNLRFLV